MFKAQILTPWVGDGTDGNPNRPQLGDDHVLKKWEDVTGQDAAGLPPDPNLYIVEITCEDATLAAIQSDATYQILWSEVIDES